MVEGQKVVVGVALNRKNSRLETERVPGVSGLKMARLGMVKGHSGT